MVLATLHAGLALWGVRHAGVTYDECIAEIGDAVKGAGFVMMLMPDEHIAAAYKSEVEPNMK